MTEKRSEYLVLGPSARKNLLVIVNDRFLKEPSFKLNLQIAVKLLLNLNFDKSFENT